MGIITSFLSASDRLFTGTRFYYSMKMRRCDVVVWTYIIDQKDLKNAGNMEVGASRKTRKL